jgi:single-stranded DNA-binding protein
MYQPINQVRLRGFLTESAHLFVSRSGQPRIAFRMEVWIDDENLPPKKSAGGDYFPVVAFGTDYLHLLPQLGTEREVTLVGRLRSRDIDTDGRHIVTEIVAHEIVPLKTRADAVHEKGRPHVTLQ